MVTADAATEHQAAAEGSSLMVEERGRDSMQTDPAVQQEGTQAGQLQVERVPRAGEQEAQSVPAAQDQEDQVDPERGGPSQEQAQQGDAEQPETMRQALSQLKHALEQQAEHRLPELLGAGVRALFSQAARAAIERELEQAVHTAMARGLDALPDGAAWQTLEQETEQSLQAVLHEALDSVFEGESRDELEIHGQRAIQALLRKDTETAQEHLREGLRTVLDEVLTIVERHRKDAIGIALHVLTKASEETVVAKVQDGVTDILPGSDEADNATDSDETLGTAEAQARPESEKEQEHPKDDSKPMKEKLDDQGQDIRDQLADITNTLRQQLTEETNGLKDRLKEGVKSATKEGSRQFGRPPSGKTLGRQPSRRAPPGRPPSRRSPSR